MLIGRALNAALVVLEERRALEAELGRIETTLLFISAIWEQPISHTQTYAKT